MRRSKARGWAKEIPADKEDKHCTSDLGEVYALIRALIQDATPRRTAERLAQDVLRLGSDPGTDGFPIIGWGDELTWDGSGWFSYPSPRSKAKDPHQLRVNSYRVLPTRGRDGFIVFVSPTPNMQATFKALHSAGLAHLV